MLSKQDYRLMAGTFRKIYLGSRNIIFQDNGSLYREILQEFIDMLQEDNPRFNKNYFLNYIMHGTERPRQKETPSNQATTEGYRTSVPQKSPSGQAQA